MDEVMQAEIRRIDDENRRQNKRIETLEGAVKNQQDMLITINKLANNMETMSCEQKRQGDRLDRLEGAPGEEWSGVKRTIMNVVTTLITSLIMAGVIWAAVQAYIAK